jgi:20S proteasome subunit alpha 6
MQKNLYDKDCLTWNPQGRLFQVEYAMEAVNQGTCLIGIKSKNHVVLCGIRSTMHETLGFYQDKLFVVNKNIGMGISGLTPDGRIIHKYLKNECLNYNYVYENSHPVEKLVVKLSEGK